MKPIESIQVGAYTVELHYDEGGSDSPRDWDNLGTIVAWHRRYSLSDKDAPKMEPPEFLEWLKEEKAIYLPVFMYEHSGVALSTGSFSDPWDSGQVGYIYVLPDKVKKEFNVKRISPKRKEHILDCLRSIVKTYGAYLNGEVYGYVVKDSEGNTLDSCWGFIGESDYALAEGKRMAEWYADRDAIRNSVSFPINDMLMRVC